MAYEVLSSLVTHLMDWIEHLHEKCLKYQAQIETMMKEFNDLKSSYEKVKSKLSALENSDTIDHQQQQQSQQLIDPLQHQQQTQPQQLNHNHLQQPIDQHQQQVSITQTHQQLLQTPTITLQNQYQPLVTDPTQSFVAAAANAAQQAAPYVWTNGHEMSLTHMSLPYYEQQTYNFHQS